MKIQAYMHGTNPDMYSRKKKNNLGTKKALNEKSN